MCNGLAPRLSLRIYCGCRAKLETLEAARMHAKNEKHTITFTGSLSMQKSNSCQMERNKLLQLNCAELEVKFACGDGFVSSSLEKAKEHVIKTGHVLHVYGRINRPSSSHKKRGCGKAPYRKVATPVEAHVAAGGANGCNAIRINGG